jgi:hypothetical protein
MVDKLRYKHEDYVDALEDLGGEATTGEFAQKLDREPATIRRVAESCDAIEITKIGNQVNVYRLRDDAQTDEDADSARGSESGDSHADENAPRSRDDDEAQEGEDV